jgi:hypothetical protein
MSITLKDFTLNLGTAIWKRILAPVAVALTRGYLSASHGVKA